MTSHKVVTQRWDLGWVVFFWEDLDDFLVNGTHSVIGHRIVCGSFMQDVQGYYGILVGRISFFVFLIVAVNDGLDV